MQMAGWFKKMLNLDEDETSSQKQKVERPIADSKKERRTPAPIKNKQAPDYNEGRVRTVTMDSASKTPRTNRKPIIEQEKVVEKVKPPTKEVNEEIETTSDEIKWHSASRESHFKARDIPSPVFGFQKRNMSQFYPKRQELETPVFDDHIKHEEKPIESNNPALTSESVEVLHDTLEVENVESLVETSTEVNSEIGPIEETSETENSDVAEIVSDKLDKRTDVIENNEAVEVRAEDQPDVLTITADGKVKLPKSIKPSGDHFTDAEIQQIARVAAVEMTRKIRSKRLNAGTAQQELNARLRSVEEIMRKRK